MYNLYDEKKDNFLSKRIPKYLVLSTSEKEIPFSCKVSSLSYSLREKLLLTVLSKFKDNLFLINYTYNFFNYELKVLTRFERRFKSFFKVYN